MIYFVILIKVNPSQSSVFAYKAREIIETHSDSSTSRETKCSTYYNLAMSSKDESNTTTLEFLKKASEYSPHDADTLSELYHLYTLWGMQDQCRAIRAIYQTDELKICAELYFFLYHNIEIPQHLLIAKNSPP
jgi:hypothetical protein